MGLEFGFGHLLDDVTVDGLGAGEDIDAEVAAAFGPLVVLLGQDGANEPDDGSTVGEDPDHVGASADLAVKPFLGVVGPDLTPDLLRECGEREDVGAGLFEVLSHVGELLGQGIDNPVELGVHSVGVGLVVDRVQQGFDPAPRRLRGRGHEVGGVVGAAALPGGTGDRGADRGHEPGVRVRGDQLDPSQAAGGQVAEERQPAGAVRKPCEVGSNGCSRNSRSVTNVSVARSYLRTGPLARALLSHNHADHRVRRHGEHSQTAKYPREHDTRGLPVGLSRPRHGNALRFEELRPLLGRLP